MNFYRHLIFLFSLTFLFMNNGCGTEKSGSNIVVRYDREHSATISELHKFIQDWLYFKKYQNRSDVYNNALNDMITNQLKRIDFFEKGLDKNEELIQNINRIINEELVAEYFETEYVSKYANEEYAKKIYEIMDKEVVYQLIELQKPEEYTKKQLDSLQDKALAIKSEIENGKDFSLLVKEHSQNEISLMNNGFMPPVNWKQSLSDPVGDVIFRLNKNDIRVLNSDNAFSIVKIVDINKVNVAPFDSIKSKIISDIKGIYINIALEEYEKEKKELLDENNLEWNEKALNQIVQWSHTQDFYEKKYREIFQTAIDNDDNKVILTYNNSKLDYKNLLRLLDNILIMRTSENIEAEHIKDFILEAIRTDLIVKKADSLDLRKNIFNAYTSNLSLKYQIVQLYNQAEIEAKIPGETDEALHNFFNENEDGLYYQLEKRNLFVMVFDNKNEAEKVSDKIKEGTPFEKVTGRYLVKTYIKEKDGEIKSFPSNEKPVFSKIGFEMKESEVSDPVEFKDENNEVKYAIVKCYHIRPEKQLTFSDVKNSIAEDFRKYHRERIAKEVEERLWSKYQPEIKEDVLTDIISSGDTE